MDHIKDAELHSYFEKLSLQGHGECKGGRIGKGTKLFEGRPKVTTVVQMRGDYEPS